MGWLKEGWSLFKATLGAFVEDAGTWSAAALSYYTFFALPPLLILMILLAGSIWGEARVADALTAEFSNLLGRNAAEQVAQMIAPEQRPGWSGVWPTILSVFLLLFGATGAFAALQGALDRAWHVEPDPAKGGMIGRFLMKRVLSLGMVLGIAFLLLVSLVLTAFIAAVGDAIGGRLAEGVLAVADFVLSFAVITLLLASIYKILPDAKIAWRDVWIGAVVTTAFFLVGKFLIGFYLGQSNVASAYGAAAALAVIVIWIYYAAMILLFGAEFTKVWATRQGRGIEPEDDAVFVVHEKRHVRDAGQRVRDPHELREKAERSRSRGEPTGRP